MGIISDAIDALEDWCKDLFKDGIQSQFDGISDLLTDTFSQTTGTGGSGGLVNDFVTQHPSQFSNAIVALNASTDGVILQMGLLLGYTAALIFTILRTGAISKSVFNAR